MTDKPRMQIVIEDELDHLMERQGDLDVPLLIRVTAMDSTSYFADADELREWRAARESQRISEGNHDA